MADQRRYIFRIAIGISLDLEEYSFNATDLNAALRQLRAWNDGELPTRPWRLYENGTLVQEQLPA